MTVRKAVIPAAGLGTRFLPATKNLAKEMIPVIDKPGIQYVVEEAVRGGATDICIVTSRGKAALEDHFDNAPDLERHLENTGKVELLDEIRRIADLAHIFFVRQKEPLGFGHAVAQAREHVAGEAFVVMVGDEIVPPPRGDEPDLTRRMVEIHERYGGSVVAVQEVPEKDISAYGVVAGDAIEDDVVKMTRFVEKPAREDAPSNLGSRGRYVLTAGIFDALDRTKPGVGNEIQLTDGIVTLMEHEDVYAYVHRGPMFDVGKKIDYLKATLELALRRDDLAGPVADYVVELSDRLR